MRLIMDKSKWIKIAPLFVLAGVILLLWKALSLDPNTLPVERMGERLPAFTLPDLYQMDKTISNAQLPSEPSLLHVWASWCGVCSKEFPQLMQLKNKGISIIGINYRDDPDQAKAFLAESGNPFSSSIADVNGKFGLDLGVYGTPETYVIDGHGTLRYRHIGLLDDEHDIQELMLALEEAKEERAS